VWIKTNRNMDPRDPEQQVATDISKKGWEGAPPSLPGPGRRGENAAQGEGE